MTEGDARCRLYLITPPALDPARFADDLAAALDAGDVAAVQLRLKDIDDNTLRRAIDVLRPVAQSRGVAFLLMTAPIWCARAAVTAPMSAPMTWRSPPRGACWGRI